MRIMEMDKMREEFEAWHIKQCEADGMDLRELSSELDRNGDGYVYIGAQYAWRGWKASRAALYVNISDAYYQSGMLEELRVQKAMFDAGVSYK